MPASWIFWAAVVSCLIAQTAILHSMFVARAAAREAIRASRTSATLELLWAVIPALVLALVLVLSWQAMRDRGITTVPAGGAALPAPAIHQNS